MSTALMLLSQKYRTAEAWGAHHETTLVSEHNAFHLKHFQDDSRATIKVARKREDGTVVAPAAHAMRRRPAQPRRVLTPTNPPKHRTRKLKTAGVKEAFVHPTQPFRPLHVPLSFCRQTKLSSPHPFVQAPHPATEAAVAATGR